MTSLYQLYLDVESNDMRVYAGDDKQNDLNCNVEIQTKTGDGIKPATGKGICNAGNYPY